MAEMEDYMKKVIRVAVEKMASAIEKIDELSHQRITIKEIITLLAIFILMWFAVSYIDVVPHNTPDTLGYENYADWNLIQIIFN